MNIRFISPCLFFRSFPNIKKVWAINNDPARKFDPSRHMHDISLSTESAAKVNPAERDHFTFGSGHRICLGMHVADRSLFLAMPCMLWAFKIGGGKDKHGNYEVIEHDAIISVFSV